MDDDSENLAALKRAYAEMILNTAREAASRVADADRRAAGFHRELCFARDEAVRMLVKLKHMLDAKTVEAETTIAKKQEQIEELEAQLEEAESKILDLRMELEYVRDELEVEKAKNNIQSSENKSSSGGDLPHHRLNSLEPIVPYLSDSELNSAVNQHIKERLMNDRETVQMSCNGIDPVRQLADPSPEGAVDQKTDLAAMVIGRKEREPYRNGFTQRVRAFEGHLLQGTLGCKLNCGSCDKGENGMHSFSQPRNLETAKVIPLQNLERPAIMRKKHRKATWAKKSKSAQIPVYAKQWRRQHLVSSLALSQSYSTENGADIDKGFQTDQIESVRDSDAQDGPLNLQKRRQSSDLHTIEGKTVKRNGKRKGRRGKNLNDEFQFADQSHFTESSHFHLGQATPVERKTKSKAFDNIGIINEEKSEGSSSSGLVAKEGDKIKDDIAVNNVLVPYEESEPGSNSVNSDVDVERNVPEDGSCVQSDDNRVVKYTFQRKRKRAFSGNDSENQALLGNTVKKHAGNMVKSRLESNPVKQRMSPRGIADDLLRLLDS
ncbi:hypothetical protein MLD38_013183 [Melastoma candidum]|uniref:Uncharacterized protein n=1 Tax=Melastoma candidum TaxID=119954 RepID=A0ACB9R8V8_9MYRT|nr:hypothetical protein MLD38_013183 [Melastoma candidum]